MMHASRHSVARPVNRSYAPSKKFYFATNCHVKADTDVEVVSNLFVTSQKATFSTDIFSNLFLRIGVNILLLLLL